VGWLTRETLAVPGLYFPVPARGISVNAFVPDVFVVNPRLALRGPLRTGVNVTLMAQLLFAGMLAPQLLLWL
jgi:hypothetical protein